jgi:hypothetical protein
MYPGVMRTSKHNRGKKQINICPYKISAKPISNLVKTMDELQINSWTGVYILNIQIASQVTDQLVLIL